MNWIFLSDLSSAKLLLLVWVLYLSMVQLLITTCLTSAAHMEQSHTRASSQPLQRSFSFLCHHFQRFSSLIVCQSSQPYWFALGHLLPLPFVALRLASVCSLASFFFFRPEKQGENLDECLPKDDKRQTDSMICSTCPLLSFPFLLLTHARMHSRTSLVC